MNDLDKYCDRVLHKTQEMGGRISAVTYQALVEDDKHYFYQVKAKLYALGLIERRDDNRIFLTPKGLKAKNIKHAEKMDKPESVAKKYIIEIIIGLIVGIISAILIKFLGL